jgi:type VI secretion system protein ImpJ
LQETAIVIDSRMIPEAVLWHEGMLLSPQHFQQADRRNQELQSYMISAAAPYCWGIRRLQIDDRALEEGRFAVTELEAIMPDGLLVLHSDDPKVKLELDLGDTGWTSVAVHLTVAAQSTPAVRDGEQLRYRQVEGAEVVDENTGHDPIRIPRLVPRLALHPTKSPLDAPPSRLTSMPLAVLESDGQRFTRVDYEPPRLRVERETLLYQVASGIVRDLRVKANDWSSRLSGARSRALDVLGDSIAILRTIVRGLPRLEALLHIEVAHPFDVYLALCDIAGDLAVVRGHFAAQSFDAYAQADPLAAYRVVERFVQAALKELRTPNISKPFAHMQPGRFELELLPEYLVSLGPGAVSARNLVVGARIAPGQEAASVKAWFDAAVIGAAPVIESLLNNAALGARRTAIDQVVELDLVPPPNMLLFSVTADPAFVTVGEKLQISQVPEPGQAEPEELRLYFPAPQERDS